MQTLRAANCEDQRIETCEGIEATDDGSGTVIMLGFYQRGVAVLLTYDEALAMGQLLKKMAQATRHYAGGAYGERARGARP